MADRTGFRDVTDTKPTTETHDRVRVKRREHWRDQRYGPGRSLTKKVRIRETYVMGWRLKDANYSFRF